MGDIQSVLSTLSRLFIAAGGLCGIAALIMFGISKMSPEATNGVSEARLVGLAIAAVAFFMAAGLVTQISVS